MAENLATVTSYGPSAGSARVRIFDWLDHLGLSAESHTYLGGSNNAARSLARHPVAVARAERRLRRLAPALAGRTLLLSRQASPLSTGRTEERLLHRAGWSAYDFDDALHTLTTGPFPKARIWRRSVSAADVVIAGNHTLAEAASALNPRVVVVPSCVEPSQYRQKTDHALIGLPRAVWIGSPATEGFLQSIAGALLDVHRSHGLRLTVISAGDRDLGPLAAMADRVVWTPDGYAAALADADIGIMPLPDDPWTRGKCGYKLLQYAASGLPFVASPVGANREIATAADGLTASTVPEWTAALRQLLDEADARRAQRGRTALEAVRSRYSFSAWAGTWSRAVGLT